MGKFAFFILPDGAAMSCESSILVQSPPLNWDRLGAIKLSPLSEVPFNRWKVLPYYRHSKGCTTACVIIRLCISVLGKAQENSQTAETKHKTAGVQGARTETTF